LQVNTVVPLFLSVSTHRFPVRSYPTRLYTRTSQYMRVHAAQARGVTSSCSCSKVVLVLVVVVVAAAAAETTREEEVEVDRGIFGD